MNTDDQDQTASADSDLLDIAELLLGVRESVQAGASVSPQLLRIVLQHAAALLDAYAGKNAPPEAREFLDDRSRLLRESLRGIPRTRG